jgi:hypothetical protein
MPPKEHNSNDQYIIDKSQHSSLLLLPPQPVSKDEVIKKLLDDTDLMKELFRKLVRENRGYVREVLNATYVADNDEMPFRTVDRETAKREIDTYIGEHPRCRTGQIIEDLRLEPEFTMEILKELKTERAIQSKPIE